MNRARILVVDDDPLNIEVLCEILADLYQVDTAANGTQALAVAAARRPDLILLDVMMPGIDGCETVRRLRASSGTRHVKVILVSARTSTGERLAGYEAGADDYMTKPFDHDELLAKVGVYLRLKSEEELGDLKSQLLDLVAHEIRTPLTGILPAAEFLLDDGEMDATDRRAFVEMILDNANRLSALAEQGLEVCRLRAQGAAALQFEEVDLAGLAQRVTANAPVTVAVDDSLTVRGDASLLERALRELVANAASGSTLRLRAVEHGIEIEIAGADLLSGEAGTTVFEDFGARRADGQVVGGRLDLALAREVLRAHGGNLDLVEVPRGTVLRGTLAARQAATTR